MSKTCALCFLLLVSTTLSAHSNQGPYQRCGRYLSALLATICDSRYNTPNINKRSVPSMPTIETMDSGRSRDDVIKFGDFMVPRKHAIQLLKGKRRVKRGVYDECCKKPCTYSELDGYCAPSNKD